MSTAAVILAAGSAAPHDRTKDVLLAELKGRPLLSWAVSPAAEAGLDELIVVSGVVDLSDAVPPEVTLLRNDDWDLGTATSLRVAIDWCHRAGHQSAVVGLGTEVGIEAASWKAVATAPGGPVVTALYGRRRGSPVRLDDEVWSTLPIDGDHDARSLVARHPELVSEVACSGRPREINSREELSRWR